MEKFLLHWHRQCFLGIILPRYPDEYCLMLHIFLGVEIRHPICEPIRVCSSLLSRHSLPLCPYIDVQLNVPASIVVLGSAVGFSLQRQDEKSTQEKSNANLCAAIPP